MKVEKMAKNGEKGQNCYPLSPQAVHEQLVKDFDARKVLSEHDVAYDRRAHRVDIFARCQVQHKDSH